LSSSLLKLKKEPPCSSSSSVRGNAFSVI
jgi:hypothetical protein